MVLQTSNAAAHKHTQTHTMFMLFIQLKYVQ